MSTSVDHDHPSQPHGAAWGPAALEAKRAAIRDRLDSLAARRDQWVERHSYFYREVFRLLRFIIAPGRSLLNIRCQTGVFLEALAPACGVGVEVSEAMVQAARQRRPTFAYHRADPETLDLGRTFDDILFNDVADTADVHDALLRAHAHCHARSRLVIYTYNHFWEPILTLADRVGMRMPTPDPNWLSEQDLDCLLQLTGFELIRTYRAVLMPKPLPLLGPLINRGLARLPGINRLCMLTAVVARPRPGTRPAETPPDRDAPRRPAVSVIVPCRNERDNIELAVRRLPVMGHATELIFCDDQSTDGTADEVRRMQAAHPDRLIRLVHGPAKGKAANVWTGFDAATGDVLMILDADLAVMPEELPRFYEALVSGTGEFINGCRLVYPMQTQAMKYTNMVGNHLFSAVFSFILSQRIRDTLCGTKVMWRDDWIRIKPWIGRWGIEDLWGDFDLLFSAARLQLKIIDLPVHYQERIHGSTKMVRVMANGWRMGRIALHAMFSFKCGY